MGPGGMYERWVLLLGGVGGQGGQHLGACQGRGRISTCVVVLPSRALCSLAANCFLIVFLFCVGFVVVFFFCVGLLFFFFPPAKILSVHLADK